MREVKGVLQAEVKKSFGAKGNEKKLDLEEKDTNQRKDGVELYGRGASNPVG